MTNATSPALENVTPAPVGSGHLVLLRDRVDDAQAFLSICNAAQRRAELMARNAADVFLAAEAQYKAALNKREAETTNHAEEIQQVAEAFGMPLAPGWKVIERARELSQQNTQMCNRRGDASTP